MNIIIVNKCFYHNYIFFIIVIESETFYNCCSKMGYLLK